MAFIALMPEQTPLRWPHLGNRRLSVAHVQERAEQGFPTVADGDDRLIIFGDVHRVARIIKEAP